jgi:hypothetical protein
MLGWKFYVQINIFVIIKAEFCCSDCVSSCVCTQNPVLWMWLSLGQVRHCFVFSFTMHLLILVISVFTSLSNLKYPHPCLTISYVVLLIGWLMKVEQGAESELAGILPHCLFVHQISHITSPQWLQREPNKHLSHVMAFTTLNLSFKIQEKYIRI